MKGLIIKEPWATLILSGQKSLEIRGSNTKNIEKVAVIVSGTGNIYGTVDICNSFELDELSFNMYKDYHKLNISYNDLLRIYNRPHAWVLSNMNKLPNPIPYKHKQGQVIWVNLDKPTSDLVDKYSK